MGEIRDLIGIYGEIDHAVLGETDRRRQVSRLFPYYDDPEFSWFKDFERWTYDRRGADGSHEPPFPELEAALDDLATIEPVGRMRARRLFVMAAAVQARPDMLEGDLARKASAALVGRTLAPDADHAHELLQLLGDPGLLSTLDPRDGRARDEWWSLLLEATSQRGLTPPEAVLGPRPCVGALTMVSTPDGDVPCATLTAGFTTNQLPFSQAIRFLDPSNWPDCNRFWTEMTLVEGAAPGPMHYHEVVSTDGNSPLAWSVSAELEFTFQQVGQQAAVVYRLLPPHPQPNDDVLIDEGTLFVEELPDGSVKVLTTKRVRFNQPFSGEALAMIMCALGYANVCEDLVFTCGLDDEATGTDFPGVLSATGKGPPPPDPPDPLDILTTVAGNLATAAKASIDDVTQTFNDTVAQINAGTFTADAFVTEATNCFKRLLTDGATVFDIGTEGARQASRARRMS